MPDGLVVSRPSTRYPLSIQRLPWTLIGVNLLGVMNVVRAFVPHLRGQPRRGHIVNTASLAGFAPPTGARAGAYAATKAAVVSVSVHYFTSFP